ncbi:NAD(P)/FAD-dependent oxidoreductase [Desulfuromonas sp. AOP6]|uniref:NAD(P)/FAD-dependent oxidoreductase n=1 Tax=Desulfuromonas sp. AOP6 TaxID=1566351 RepID=UPI00128A30D3|nr:NAD(P)/FAD-dependent oxidoreductase [Desulfuromonas sp. AOP6]BCA79204.1 aminoacetone oxidase family FAD-binding enzyme [Desulfuromonas sp. AOP6]
MKTYDVIVIGGGAAGMFAAGFAASKGAKVLLLEKNKRCGAKILITGKGRCNLTNSEADPRKFIAPFGKNGKALLTALYAFGVAEVMRFFEERGVPLKVERGGRIFPAQGDANDVNRVLERFLAETGVELLTGCEAKDLDMEDDRISAVTTSRGRFAAARFIVATGGLSYPETGCTGDGYEWAARSGHRVVTPEPALVAVRLQESWTAEVMDFNLKNVKITACLDGKPFDERFGQAFFTRGGIGGPIVLDMSSAIRDALKKGRVTLILDMKPAVEASTFDGRLQRELAEHKNRDFGNSLAALLPKDMIPLFLRLSGIDPQKKCHSVTRQERQTLLNLFKALTLHVSGCEGFAKAIITAGGVSLSDIDMRTMRSKKVPNLFFAGEVIDLHAPTGGYNLQECWSTGFLAGTSAAAG